MWCTTGVENPSAEEPPRPTYLTPGRSLLGLWSLRSTSRLLQMVGNTKRHNISTVDYHSLTQNGKANDNWPLVRRLMTKGCGAAITHLNAGRLEQFVITP